MSLLGNTAELAILLKLKDEFTGPLNKASSSLDGINTRAGKVAGGFATMGKGLAVAAERIAAIGVTAGVALTGIAVNATQAASSFQAAMELIRTQAGGTQQEVNSMSTAILAMAGSVGTSPDVLATGLYHIESAGLRGAKALDILKVAAEGAKVGNADLESVTNALIASVNSGIKGTTDMTQAMGVLNAIVGSGNMRMQDLTDAFSTGILSSAKTFGISIQSVGAAIADMTNQGVPAIDAATRLRMTISLLGAPTSKAAKSFEAIGLASTDLANTMRGPGGIAAAVTQLADHMQKAGMIDKNGNPNTAGATFLSGAFGGGRSSSAIMTLVGSIGKLDSIQKQVNTSTGTFGDAWTATQADVNTKVESVRASLDTLKITLGERLLPVASRVLDELNKVLSSPAVIAGVDQIGQSIAGMFSADNISKVEAFTKQVAIFAYQILPPLVDGLKIAGTITSTAIGAFMSLPAGLQAIIIGGLAVNKLSGGLVATGLKQVAQGLLQGGGASGAGGVVGGMLGVQKVFVVNMAEGGMGGGGGGVSGAAKGALGGGVLAAGLTVAAGAAVAGVAVDQYIQTSNHADQIASQTGDFVKTATLAQLKAARQAVADGAQQLIGQWWNPFAAAAENGLNNTLAELNTAIDAKTPRAGGTGGNAGQDRYPVSLSATDAGVMARAVAKGLEPTKTGIAATLAKNSIATETAFRNYRNGEHSDLATIKHAVDAVTTAVAATTAAVRGVSILNSPSLTTVVHVNVSARQNETATANANAYGPSASRAGAQGAPTRAGGW
jgi:TP901 family phage tail tape measure protein